MKEQNGRLPGETALALTYYELYRALPPSDRSLRTLTQQEVNGKKRSASMLAKWSTRYNWQARVAVHDTEVARKNYLDRIKRQQTEITAFIDEDMDIALKIQKLCKSRLEKLEQPSANLDCRELRQVTLAYKESREWLKELIGILPEEEEDDGEEAEEG